MKKILYSVLIATLLFIPAITLKAEVVGETLKQACKSENITFNSSTYKESDDKVNVYIFRGSGCSHCHDALVFFESIVEEYGDYFNVVSYETWNNQSNSELMTKVATFKGEEVTGVPYIVIGTKSWKGFASSLSTEIKDAIKSEYDSTERYDVMEEMNSKKDNTKTSSDLNGLVICILIAAVLFDGFLLIKTTKDKKDLEHKMYLLETKIKNMPKEAKKDLKKNNK